MWALLWVPAPAIAAGPENSTISTTYSLPSAGSSRGPGCPGNRLTRLKVGASKKKKKEKKKNKREKTKTNKTGIGGSAITSAELLVSGAALKHLLRDGIFRNHPETQSRSGRRSHSPEFIVRQSISPPSRSYPAAEGHLRHGHTLPPNKATRKIAHRHHHQ